MRKLNLHKRRETTRLRDCVTLVRPGVPKSRVPKSKDKRTRGTRLVPYLAMVLVVWLSACKERVAAPETTTSNKAAMELYCKYADNSHLTVAYLGDLSVNGKCIDALMLQADNEADWDLLKQDFGFMSYDTAAFNCPDDDNPVMVGVGIETDFLSDAIFDTVTDISQIPDEAIDRYTLVVADKIREIMNSFQAPDSLLPNTAIVVGQGEIGQDATDNTYDDYIVAVSRSVVIGMISDRIGANATDKNGATATLQEDSVTTGPMAFSSLQQQNEQRNRIMDDMQTYGHIGYITAADNEERTLWLFFYDDQEECNTIITHIREDMIINYK